MSEEPKIIKTQEELITAMKAIHTNGNQFKFTNHHFECDVVLDSMINFGILQCTFRKRFTLCGGIESDVIFKDVIFDGVADFTNYIFSKNVRFHGCTFNDVVRFNNTISFNEAIQGILKLRELHKSLDEAVLKAYGWHQDDPKWVKAIQLRHDFYEVDYLPENDRVRYTIHPEARKEVLKRLLQLNHERYAEEVAEGLHDKKKASKKNVEKKKK